MATNITRERYQGLWLPMDLTHDASIAEQAGPRPGVIVADRATGLRLVGTGTQSSGDSYDYRAQRAGYPTGKASGLGMLWKPDDSADWRGWDEPATVTAWAAAVEAEVGDPMEPRWPSAIPLQSGKLLIAYGAEETSEKVYVRAYNPTTATWATAVQVYTHPTLYASGFECVPQLVQLPSGRVLCFFIVYRPAGLNVSMAFSDDDGATWTLGARDVLPAALTVNAAGAGAAGYQSSHGLAVAYHPLGISLFIGLRRAETDAALITAGMTILRQYASDSLGSAFTFIAGSPSINTLGDLADDFSTICAHPVILATPSGALILLAPTYHTDFVPLEIGVRVLGDPWQSWLTVTATQIGEDAGDLVGGVGAGTPASRTAALGDVAAWIASNGSIYTIARGSDNMLRVKRSQDAGTTWEAVGLGSVTGDFTSGQYLHRLSACYWQERAVVLSQGDAGVGGTEPTVGLLMLGGWTTVPRSAKDSGYEPKLLAVLPNLWLPYTQPDLAGWGATGAGSFTLTPSGGTVNSTAAAKLYDVDPGGTPTDGVTVEIEVTPTSGGIATDQVVLTLRLADGTDDYQVTVRIGTASILARDDNAGASLGSVTMDTTAGVMIFVDLVGDSVRVYWRPRNIGSDRNYELLATSDTLTNDTATPAATNRITWGGSGIAVAEWHRVSWGGTTAVGAHIMDRSSPRDLTCLHPSRSRFYVDRGLWVTPHDGPAYAADQWSQAPAYDYPGTVLSPFVSPTPRRKWRSTATASTNTHTWTIDAAGNRISSPMLAILGVGCNFRTFNIRRTDGAGVTTTAAIIDVSAGLTALDFARSGVTLVPAVTATGSVYMHQSEMVGGSVDFGGGVVHRIVAQTEGRWGGTGRQATITLDASAGAGATGAMSIVPPSWLAVIPVPIAEVWRAVGVQITTQTTADGYFEAGILWPGLVEVFGFPPSWGSGGVELAGEVEESAYRDGTRRRVQTAPAGRVLTAAWPDAMDQTGVSPGNVNPDYLTPWTGGRAGATWQATPTHLAGLLRDLQSGATPCAWLRRLEQGNGSAQIVNRREQFVYGHIEGAVSINDVLGSPDHDQVVRVASVTLREQT